MPRQLAAVLFPSARQALPGGDTVRYRVFVEPGLGPAQAKCAADAARHCESATEHVALLM